MSKIQLCAGLCLLVACGLSNAAANDRIHCTIIDVRHNLEPVPVKVPTNPMMRTFLPKFSSAAIQGMRETFSVTWRPDNPLPAGAVAVFEYRQARAKKIARLSIKYPFAIASKRTAHFIIPAAAWRQSGPVRTWRVLIKFGNRILARRSSPNWKASNETK